MKKQTTLEKVKALLERLLIAFAVGLISHAYTSAVNTQDANAMQTHPTIQSVDK